MRKKLPALLLVLALVCVNLAGCNRIISFTNPVEKRKESISNFLSKDVTGKIGGTYKTKWFEFTIHSIEEVDSYAGHTAEEGHRLFKVLITETNMEDKAIPMGLFDFYMDDPAFSEYIWAISPLDDTMMPEKFNLEPSESVQYVMVFEVPTDTSGLALTYTENDESGKDGASFAIYIDKK